MGCRVSLQIHPLPLPKDDSVEVIKPEEEEESIETKLTEVVLSNFESKKESDVKSKPVPLESKDSKDSYTTVYLDEGDFV